MKTNKNSTRWLGLALAGGILTLAASAQAGKPVKPPIPPPEPSGPAYRLITLDGENLDPNAISDSGILAGLGFYQPDPNDPSWRLAGFSLSPRMVAGEIQYLAEDVLRLVIEDGDDTWSESRALAMNGAGIVVGWAWTPYAQNRAILWLVDGTPIDLGVAPADANSQARAINNSGLVVVGLAGHSTAGVVVPWDADEDGEPDVWFTDFDTNGINDLFYPIEVGSSLTPVAINEAGQVALKEGYLLTPDFGDADGDGNPWFADSDGDNVNDLLTALAGPAADVEVNDLNNVGQVVGNSGGHVVRWDFVDGVQIVTDLGSLSASLNMFPKRMNDAGRIVGTSTKTVGKGHSGPPWLIEGETIYELSTLFVNPEAWSGGGAVAINNHGWISGRGFVAIPVEQP